MNGNLLFHITELLVSEFKKVEGDRIEIVSPTELCDNAESIDVL